MVYFYRQSISDRSSPAPLFVMYGVVRTPGHKPDPVPAVGFPRRMAPDRESRSVPRQARSAGSSGRRAGTAESVPALRAIGEAEALALFPDLLR
jgi:hypothetical protein